MFCQPCLERKRIKVPVSPMYAAVQMCEECGSGVKVKTPKPAPVIVPPMRRYISRTLVAREKLVLRLRYAGYGLPEIAGMTGLTLGLVKKINSQVLDKLGCDNIVHAVTVARDGSCCLKPTSGKLTERKSTRRRS